MMLLKLGRKMTLIHNQLFDNYYFQKDVAY